MKQLNYFNIFRMPKIPGLLATSNHMAVEVLAYCYNAVIGLVDDLFKASFKPAVSSFIALMQLVYHS